MRREMDDLQGDTREGRRGMKTKTVYVVQAQVAFEHWIDIGIRDTEDLAIDLEDEFAGDNFTRIIKRTEEVIE